MSNRCSNVIGLLHIPSATHPDQSSLRVISNEEGVTRNFAPREAPMSVVRLLPAWLHAIADYAVAAALIIGAAAVGGTSGAVATGIVVGVVVAVVSMLTKYPLGVVKVLPFKVHSAGDYLAAALLILAPFVVNFRSSDTGLAVFYMIVGLAVLGVSLITNYQYSPKREWSAVRATAQTA